MTYQDQIKSPKWQKKRLEALEMHNFKCQECNETESTLHIHHPYYKKGKKIWEYKADELQCLCEKCHKLTHELDDKIRKELSDMDIMCGIRAKIQVLGYIKGINDIPVRTLESTKEADGYMDAYGINGRAKLFFSEYLVNTCHGSIRIASESIKAYFDNIGDACCDGNKTEEDLYRIITEARQIASRHKGGR